MKDVVRCGRCRKVLIDEEFDSHSCYIKPNNSKIVDIDYYIIQNDTEGNTFIITKTLDGTLLTLKKSDESLQRYRIGLSDGKLPEPCFYFLGCPNKQSFQISSLSK